MMKHERVVNNSPEYEEIRLAEAAISDAGLVPFGDEPLALSDEDNSSGMHPVIRGLQGQYRRYLLQVSCDRPAGQSAADHRRAVLALLVRSIETLGGTIEERWGTPGEYDLICVLRLATHQLSVEAIVMVLNAMPLVKALRTIPLLPLDEPAGAHDNGADANTAADYSTPQVGTVGRDSPDDRLIIDAIESMNWEED